MSKPALSAADIIAAVDRFAPVSLAFPDDPVGLQVGRVDKPVKRVCLALDASPAVIAHAVRSGADLLLTHHELFYRPLARLDTSTWRGHAIAEAVRHDLTIYAAHTNLDVTEGGVNDVLANLLGLTDVEILDRLRNERLRKLVVFVPRTHADAVRDAICTAGAGHIGKYSHCTFNTAGSGTFFATEGANPFLGQVGSLTVADEIRLETVVPEDITEPVIRAMLAAHPYEEVAYDLYPLDIMGRPLGIGRVGNIAPQRTLREFAEHVRDRLHLPHLRFGGDPDAAVSRVAVVGGSGGRWAPQALAKGAQVLVTADCDHHRVAEAWEDGLAIIDATHAALELPALDALRNVLHGEFGDAIEIEVAPVGEDPFRWI